MHWSLRCNIRKVDIKKSSSVVDISATRHCIQPPPPAASCRRRFEEGLQLLCAQRRLFYDSNGLRQETSCCVQVLDYKASSSAFSLGWPLFFSKTPNCWSILHVKWRDLVTQATRKKLFWAAGSMPSLEEMQLWASLRTAASFLTFTIYHLKFKVLNYLAANMQGNKKKLAPWSWVVRKLKYKCSLCPVAFSGAGSAIQKPRDWNATTCERGWALWHVSTPNSTTCFKILMSTTLQRQHKRHFAKLISQF